MDLARLYNDAVGYKERVYRNTIFPRNLPDEVLDKIILNSITYPGCINEVVFHKEMLRNKPRLWLQGDFLQDRYLEGYVVLAPAFNFVRYACKSRLPPAYCNLSEGGISKFYRAFIVERAGDIARPLSVPSGLAHYVGYTRKGKPLLYNVNSEKE